MENIVYERDYKDRKPKQINGQGQEISTAIFNYLMTSGTFNAMEDAYIKMPRVVNEAHQAAYDRILDALDQIAKIFGGKIKGEVDYQNWEASIYIILPFVEFSTEDELKLLRDIASNSQTVIFTPTPDGNVRMKLLINYFDVIGNIDDTLENEIANCPELVAMLEEADRAEKKQLMASPEIAMLVQLGADSTGVSEIEYLDRLVSFLRNPPNEFTERIRGWMDCHIK